MAGDSPATTGERLANVEFASALLHKEIDQRNARKDAQESTARWIVLTAGAVMTLLLGLAKDAGLFSADTNEVARGLFVLALAAAGLAAAFGVGTIWPRKYDRIGEEGLDKFNKMEFLDQPTHQVTGTVAATRIGIAKTMDSQHEKKSWWLHRSLVFLVVAVVALVGQGGVLAIDPPSDHNGENGPSKERDSHD